MKTWTQAARAIIVGLALVIAVALPADRAEALRGPFSRIKPLLTPALILGPLMFADYYAADRDNPAAVNPRITLSGSNVTSWPEEETRNAALGLGGGNSAISATSFGGKPGVTFSGTSGLTATLSPTIASGARIYMWVVASFTTTTLPDTYGGLVEVGAFSTPTVFTGLLLIYGQKSNSTLYSAHNNAGGNDTITGPALSTSRLVYETGELSTTTAQLVVGGTGYNGARTDATGAAFNKINFGARIYTNGDDAYHGPVVIHRVVLAHNPNSITAQPSTYQIAAMRDLLRNAL